MAKGTVSALRNAPVLYAVALVFLLTTATNLGPFSSQFGPYYLAILLSLIWFLAMFWPGVVIPIALTRVFIFGGFCFAAIWLTALMSLTGQQLVLAMQMFMMLIIYVVAALLAGTAGGGRAIGAAMFLAMSTASLINLYEFFIAPNILSESPGRAAGFFINPNESGMMIAGLLGLWMAFRSGRLKLWVLAPVVLSLLAISVTFSRGAAFILVAVMVVIFWVNWKRRGRKLSLVLVAVLVVLISGMAIGWFSRQDLSAGASMRLDSLVSGRLDDESSMGRFDSAMDYIARFLESPIAGAGPLGTMTEETGRGPHNSFIGVAADFGLAGILCYLAILVIGLRSAWRLGWHDPRAVAQLVIVVWLTTASMFSHNILYNPSGALMIGILLGSVASTGKLRKLRPDNDGR